MDFSYRVFKIGLELADIDKRTKKGRELREELRELWRNATDEDLCDYADYIMKILPISFEEAHKRAKETRFRHQAKKEIENQNHSGMSFGLVCAMVKEFCSRGQEFVEYVK